MSVPNRNWGNIYGKIEKIGGQWNHIILITGC